MHRSINVPKAPALRWGLCVSGTPALIELHATRPTILAVRRQGRRIHS